MRPIRIIILLVSLSFSAFSQQQVLLLTEDFEAPSNTFAFDTGGIINHYGNNRWIVNNQYDGGSIYPLTTNQDSTVAGTITNSPYSTYLHIHDEAAAANQSISNTNYDATTPSDRFAYTSLGFCTRGLTDVTVAFFYLCEGGPGAYGEFSYSVNGGPWTTGGQYANQTKWKYVALGNAAFENVENLRIGFRWINGAGAPDSDSTMSFAVDDILVVGSYDTLNPNTPRLSVPFVSTPVCRTGNAIVQWHLTAPLCDGTYKFELSNINGIFPPNPLGLGTFSPNPSDDTTGFFALTIPAFVGAGSCYRIRVVRMSPAPSIISSVSECFVVESCPNIITTLEPLILTDVDTACVQSIISVPFYSTGAYNASNSYIAQLSDVNGRFDRLDTTIAQGTFIDTTVFPPDTIVTFDTIVNTVTTYTVINSNPDRNTYDPATGSDPGTVGGLIPVVPEGCNYFIRIVSTNPTAIGSTYGPFCLKHCDIETNKTESINVCIHETVGDTVVVPIDIHKFDSLATYLAGNSFKVQLLNKMDINDVINEGALGLIFDTVSSQLLLIVPGANSFPIGRIGVPEFYYMRIVADSSTTPWNMNGTVVGLTIGVIRSSTPTLTPNKTVFCNSEVAEFTTDPFDHPPFDYEYLSAQLNNGVPFTWEFNPLRVDFTGAAPGPYSVRVRESSYGCVGQFSGPASVFVTTIPDVVLDASTVCQGDSVLYAVTFLPATYYEWSLSWGNIIDTSNNEIYVTFDSSGMVDVGIYALNVCGVRDSSYKVEVIKSIKVDAEPDTTICAGAPVQLTATISGYDKEVLTVMSGITQSSRTDGVMFNIKANYDLTIKSFDGNFTLGAPMDMEVYYRPGPYSGSETDITAWIPVGTADSVIADTSGTPTPIPIPINLNMLGGQTFSFYITVANTAKRMIIDDGTAADSLYKSDGVLEFYEGASLTYPFTNPGNPDVWNGIIHYFTEQGVDFAWSNGDSIANPTVRPQATTNYFVEASDNSVCPGTDRITVFVNPLPPLEAGENDTMLCKGEGIQLSASGADAYQWSPTDGLDNPNSNTPTVTLDDSKVYLLAGTDTATGCVSYDTVTVTVEGCELTISVPQAFTPDGKGGNNFFTVFGDNIDKYEIRIFNRWGEQVYYSNNVSELSQGDLTKGWNGEYKGRPQDTGVYVYHIKVSKGNAAPVERKGNVTLIR